MNIVGKISRGYVWPIKMKKAILMPMLMLFLIVFVVSCTEKRMQTPQPDTLQETTKEALEEEKVEETPEEKIGELEKTGELETPEMNESAEETLPAAKEEVKEIPADWPTFHGNNARTGFSDAKAPSAPTVLWKWTIGDFQKAGVIPIIDSNWPIIKDDRAFFALSEEVFAAEVKTGKKRWRFKENAPFYPIGIAAGGGKIFVTVNNDDNLDAVSTGFIYALDEKTGAFLWKLKTDREMPFSLPLYADGMVFAGDNSGKVYAIDAGGRLIWKKGLEAAVIHSSPAYEDGIVFIGTESSIGPSSKPSHLYALDADKGDVKWKFEIDTVPGKLNLVHAAPTISKGVVYFGAENGYFYAVSASDGSLIWKQKIASGSGELIGVSAAAAVGYGKVFVGTYEGKFLALDQKDGKQRWEYAFGRANADSSAVVADNKVYFGTGEGGSGYFYSLNAGNGDLIWKERLGGASGALAGGASGGILVVYNKRAEENLNPETPLIIAFSDEGGLSLW